MVNARLPSRRSNGSLLLVLAGALLLLPSNLTGQTAPAPAQSGTAAESQLPAEVQAKLDKLQADLKAAQNKGDAKAQAETFTSIGGLFYGISEYQEALEYYSRALMIQRALEDAKAEARTLSRIGHVYSALGEPEKALPNLNQALLIQRKLGDLTGEASTLNILARLYGGLGETQKVPQCLNEALAAYRAVGDKSGEASTLTTIGAMYFYQGEQQNTKQEVLKSYEQALNYYDQAISIQRALPDRFREAWTLRNIGLVFANLGDTQKALEYLNEALPLYDAVGDREGEASTLNYIGRIYYRLGETKNALKYLNMALPLAIELQYPFLEVTVLSNLFLVQKKDNPALAIYYGKQAVNILQEARSHIRELGKDPESYFLAREGNTYRELANLLIDQGRLPEAEQVLDLLKEQEYSDYVRGETADTLSPLTLTPAEKQAEEDYQKSTAQLVSLGEQWAELKKLTSRTPEQEKQYQQLSDQLDAASKGLNDYYARLFKLLGGKNSDANKQLADVKGDVSLLEDQVAETPHTVALYTMVTSDHYRVIVITAAATVAREYAISDKDLYKKVSDFQQVLRDPVKDPKPLAQELYKILIGPVKADLDQAKAETLVWSLDGVLRYVPMAALYDGKQYVVESYNTVTITPASIAHLAEKPDVSNLSAAAMGISRRYEDNLPPLPAVVGELGDVVKDAQVQGAHGVLPGSILLNNQFTEKAMENQLGGRHAVVHIASHFVFKPGDDSQSYLLLAGKNEGGTGYHLTVADFRDNKNLALRHTDLLTLSACETGMSGNAGNGREVDGLGTTAQLKGAKAVISSLWEVNDSSTGQLMADFYQRWAGGAGKVEKVEALRQAQLDLLLGRVKPQTGSSGRGMSRANSNAPAGFAHPYYWAPFVLMGNWR
jgi:CHAT domain-containing protein